MLACRSVLADLDDVPTLVFDEVDAGIGGEAGLAVGRRLARLADDAPGPRGDAPSADRLLRGPPRPRAQGRRAATVEVLEEPGGVIELSRMLAGMESSEHALSHAEELLGEAARVRAERRTAA